MILAQEDEGRKKKKKKQQKDCEGILPALRFSSVSSIG